MASNKNNPNRNTRATRRAAEEAAAKAAAEQAARERKQQTIIGAVVVAIVVALVAVIGVTIWRSVSQSIKDANTTAEDAYAQVQAVKTKPTRADDKGGVLMSKDGYGKKVDNVPTIGVYMDFMCPGCGNLNRSLDATLIKMMNAGQINLDLHFLSFMDGQSTDEYSSRAAGAALYIADHDDDPNHLLDFVTNLYKEDFQPAEGSDYKSVSDDKLKEQAIKAGVSEDVASKAFGREYQDWLNAINDYVPRRTELLNTSGSYKGAFTTPTVVINGTRWDMNQLATTKQTIPDGFLESIGLDSANVGVAGKLPSIGADKEPISLMTGE